MNISKLILEKNNQFIALNKIGNIPVQADKTEDKSLMDLAEIYTKGNIYLVHRIDRPASGIVLFAKNKRAVTALSKQFQERKVSKTYLAIVKNKPEADEGTLVHYLTKNTKSNKSKVSIEETPNAKRAEMHYKVIQKSDNYFLLEIQLVTGRHHQIRAQLAAIGSPIKGDVKYGARRKNKDRSIHLHAWKLNFKHPISDEDISIVAPIPKDDVLWAALTTDLD